MILHTHRSPASRQAVRRARTGFTLLEVLVVVAIIVMLAGVGGYYVLQQYEESRYSRAKIDAEALSSLVETYKLNNEDYPTSIEMLAQQQPRGGLPLCPIEKTRDPWGQPYQIEPNGPHNQGLKADVYTTYKNRTVGNWKD